jgi:5-methylcytosine-specific restriction endonuclease McrA
VDRVSLRRYSPLKASRGTVIPPDLRRAVLERDRLCVLRQLGINHPCSGSLFLELDHVRGSGALGKKSPTTLDNLVALCPQAHRMKTLEGRVYRPLLIAYLAERAERSAVIG